MDELKKAKAPKVIKAHFPAPPQVIQTPVPKTVVPDFVLNFNTAEKITSITIPNDQMPKFAEMVCKLLAAARVVYSKEEKLL